MNPRLRLGPGSHISFEGELLEIIEIRTGGGGNVVHARVLATGQVRLISLHEVLTYQQQLPSAAADEDGETGDGGGGGGADFGRIGDDAATVLAMVDAGERQRLREAADHVREVLTGYRSGDALTAATGEPRAGYDPTLPLTQRYAAKAAELGVAMRTVQRMVAGFRTHGEAGLVNPRLLRAVPEPQVDPRWRETAVEVLVEHTDQSRPSRTAVILRTNARVIARHGEGVVALPSRPTAFRALAALEKRHPTFRLSTKRNRDIAARNPGVYGKLRPTRPGEYLLMDTTRLDVFAMDPVTWRWMQVELTVGMDWYTRCITGLRLTPVSTKSVDVASVLFQAFRPEPAPQSWPPEAVWPEHGIPRTVLLDRDAIDREGRPGVCGPTIVPQTLVIDHGKVYVSDHITSVCARMGISIQPARLRTGRDKGPVERFFLTLRYGLLQYLAGYKGPDVHSRGETPEAEAYFFIDELEAIIREWIATVYHRSSHRGLVEPGLPGMELSPVAMFERGIAAAGFLEAPSRPDLAYEFLPVVKRTIQHSGVDMDKRRYNGPGINAYRNRRSPYPGGRWPFHYHPDDLRQIYFCDPDDHQWHRLVWEHAAALDAPLSADGLNFFRAMARAKYTHPNDELALAMLLERWGMGLGRTLAERRMMLRQSRDDALLLPARQTPQSQIQELPSVRRAGGDGTDPDAESDTDASSDIDVDASVPPPPDQISDDDTDDDYRDFYLDTWEDA